MATRIQDLPAASQITTTDLFVIQQGGEAKSLTGEALTRYIAGHGGINSITLNSDYTLTFTMTDGEEITIGSIRGQNGEDGFSPSVTLTEGENGVNLTITDRLGPHTAFIPNGVDGFSPEVSFTPGEGGTNLVITDAEGSHTAFIPDGEDGFSPSVTLTPTAGGTNLTIVDATGPHTAFIANGEGSGDMLASIYDPQGEVAAVGIPAYVEAHGTQNAVRYDEDQGLTAAQKAQARENINAAAPDGYYGNSGGTMQYATNFVGQLTPQNANDVVFRPTASNFSGSGWSADSISGNTATIEKIKGKTLVFNQQFKVTAGSDTSDGITYTKNSDGSWTVTGTTNSNNHFYNLNYAGSGVNSNHFIAGHKYFVGGISSDNKVTLSARNDGAVPNTISALTGIAAITSLAATTWARIQIVTTVPIGTNINATIYPQIVDLTQMFGAGNEPTTVEEFRTMFPLDYYEYNPGELVSFNGTGLKTTGFNQLYPDGHIDVLAGLTYKIEGTYTSLKDSAGNDVAVTNGEFTPTANDTYTMVGGTCVHLKWSGVRDGDTEEHWDSTLSLPIATYFPDGMKSAHIFYGLESQVYLGELCDELSKDKAIKNLSAITLDGSNNFVKHSTNEHNWLYRLSVPDAFAQQGDGGTNDYMYLNCDNPVFFMAVSRNMITGSDDKPTGRLTGISFGYSNTHELYVNMYGLISTNDVSHVKEYFTNHNTAIVYKKAEPVETPISPELNLTYRCDDFGTEMLLPQNTSTEVLTAPMDMQVVYGLDYEANVRNLPVTYLNNCFAAAFVSALHSLGLTLSMTNDNGQWRMNFSGPIVPLASAVSDLTAKQTRNIYAGTSDMTAGSSTLPTGDIYIVYE